MRSVSDVEQLIVFQGAGHDVIRVQGVACEGGDFLYKGSGFPSFRFSPSLLRSHQTSYSSSFISWPPTLKTSSMLLVRLVVPLLGIWK
jgi:hypothetical protein